MRHFSHLAIAACLAGGCIDTSLPTGDAFTPTPDVGADTSSLEYGQCAPAFDLGDPCPDDDSFACAGSLRCIGGFCAPRSGLDGPCESSSDCGADMFCARYELDGGDVVAPSCQADKHVGDPCYRRNYGCAYPLRCIDGSCAPRSALDGPCTSDGDCESDLFCDDLLSNPPACKPEIAEGAPCEEDADGCVDGTSCWDGVCRPEGGPDAPCQSNSDCASGMYCDRFDAGSPRSVRVCRPESQLGEPCESDEISNCYSSDCIAGICVDDGPLGALCDSSGDCADDLYCLE